MLQCVYSANLSQFCSVYPVHGDMLHRSLSVGICDNLLAATVGYYDYQGGTGPVLLRAFSFFHFVPDGKSVHKFE